MALKPSTKKRDPIDELFPSTSEPEADTDVKPDTDANMLARIEALQGQVSNYENANERLEQMMFQVMGSQRKAENPVVTPTPTTPAVDTITNMPDPLQNPEAYNAELNNRINSAISNITTNLQQQQAGADANRVQESKLNALWETFQEKHEDLAGNETLIEMASKRVSNRATRRGLDLDIYMFQGDSFLNDVAREAEKIRTELGVKPKEEVVTDPSGPEPAIGILGGLPATGTQKPAASGDDNPGNLVNELQDMQRKSGYF